MIVSRLTRLTEPNMPMSRSEAARSADIE
ncbi:ORFL197C [Human betaherpesvirus 5]|nr:ORFL197C [Human betaherpesvirus 5]QHX40543.1 ORFL197C [Human betaherpesvirus 5]